MNVSVMPGLMVQSNQGDPMTAIAGFCLVLGPVLYLWGWRALRRRWMITAMPTSKARSVAMGLAEVKGRAKPLGPSARPSPIRGVPCVWSHVVVTEHKKQGKNEHTKRLVDRELREPFILEDDTGRVSVLPSGAEMHGVVLTNMTITGSTGLPEDVLKFCDMNWIPVRTMSIWSGVHYTLKEEAIISDAELYVLGEAVPGRDSVADGRRRNVADRLKAWLKDPAKKAMVDTNKDGIIQQDDWDAAQARAQEEILREDLDRKPEAPPVMPATAIRKPAMGFFLISSGTEKEALSAQGSPAALITLGLGSLALGIYLTPPDSWAGGMFWVSVGVMVFGSFLGGIKRMLGR